MKTKVTYGRDRTTLVAFVLIVLAALIGWTCVKHQQHLRQQHTESFIHLTY